MLTECIASVFPCHNRVKEKKCCIAFKIELQILSNIIALNPTSNDPRMDGKTNATYPVGIVLRVVALAIFISDKFSVCSTWENIVKKRKVCKNRCENVEKQTLS